MSNDDWLSDELVEKCAEAATYTEKLDWAEITRLVLKAAVDSGELVSVSDMRYTLAWFDRTILAEFQADVEGSRIYDRILPAPDDGDDK